MTETELPTSPPPQKHRWPLVVAAVASLIAVAAVSALVALLVTDDSTESNNQAEEAIQPAETSPPAVEAELWAPQAFWASLKVDEQVGICTTFVISGDAKISNALKDGGLTADEVGETTAVIREQCGQPWSDLRSNERRDFCEQWRDNNRDSVLYQTIGASSALASIPVLAEAKCRVFVPAEYFLSPEEKVELEAEREQKAEVDRQKAERATFVAKITGLKRDGVNLCPEFRRLGEYDFAFWLRDNLRASYFNPLQLVFGVWSNDGSDFFPRLSVEDSEGLAEVYAEEC